MTTFRMSCKEIKKRGIMKEPRIIKEEDMVKGVIYWNWPDGTLRETAYQDYVARDINPLRLFLIRVRFIWNRTVILLAHFNSIQVRKRLTGGGDAKYQAWFEHDREVGGKVVDGESRGFRLRRPIPEIDFGPEGGGKRP